MKKIINPTKMVIGTHDSCAYKLDFNTGFWKWNNKYEILRKLSFIPFIKNKIKNLTLCQEFNIYHQLTMGCRALDIRVSYKNGIFYTNHTFCCGTLDEMMQQVKLFAMENYNYEDSLFNDKITGNKIYLLIKPDWQTKNTMTNNEDKLLDYLKNKFGNLLNSKDGKMQVLCYYKAKDRLIYQRHPKIKDFNKFQFSWLNVNTIKKFKKKFNDQYKHRNLSKNIFNYVMTPNFSKLEKKMFSANLKEYASDLNPIIEEIIEIDNQPKFTLIDFVNPKLVTKIKKHYL